MKIAKIIFLVLMIPCCAFGQWYVAPGGDMSAAVYDPAGGAAQVAFASEIPGDGTAAGQMLFWDSAWVPASGLSWDDVNAWLGVGITPATKLHVSDTSDQLTLSYNTRDATFGVDSAGDFSLVTTGANFGYSQLGDPVGIVNAIGLNTNTIGNGGLAKALVMTGGTAIQRGGNCTLYGDGTTAAAGGVLFRSGSQTETLTTDDIVFNRQQPGPIFTEFMRFKGATNQVIVNENSQDVDFRVESDIFTYAFFVRGSDGYVGVGTSAPVDKFTVFSTTGPQFRGSYDASNYFTMDVGPSGVLTIDNTGVGTVFSDNVAVVGRVTEAGTFAEIHVSDNAVAQSIPSGVTYTKSTAFDSNGLSSNCTPDSANDKITITKTGVYRVDGTVSFSSGTKDIVFFGSVFLAGVEQDQIHWSRMIRNIGDVANANFTGFLDASSVPVDLDFRLRHDGVSAIDITASYANLNVSYLGE